jgi:hypothetical protein
MKGEKILPLKGDPKDQAFTVRKKKTPGEGKTTPADHRSPGKPDANVSGGAAGV